MPHKINRQARHYQNCMTPDETWRRCRPGWRSDSPEDEARERAKEILEAEGEEVTLFTRRIKGDDIDRELPAPQNNYVSALPLNFIYLYDGRFGDNHAGTFSDLRHERRAWCFGGSSRIGRPRDDFRAIRIAERPLPGQTNYIYVGNRCQFSNLSVRLFTRLKSDNVIWEYSRGNGVWLPLPMLSTDATPGASTLQESGRMVFDPSFFSDWNLDWVNGEEAFWIRAVIDENTEGTAAAALIITENIIQSVVVWNTGEDPTVYPNDKCVTVKVDGTIFNRVYDIKQLDYAEESFVLLKRDQLTEDCDLTEGPKNSNCGLLPFDTCNTDPLANIKKIGNLSLPQTTRLRELAFLYHQIMRMRQKGAGDAIVLLFTRNLRLDGKTVTATYTNQCPCVGFGRMQPIRDGQLAPENPEDNICNVCLGTEFVMGFDRYVNPERENGKILMSFPQGAFDMPLEEHGLGKTQELTTAWMAFEPRIFVRDIIIRYDEFGVETGRYIVMSRTDSRHRRGVLVHQQVVLSLLDDDKFAYRIEAPELPLAASQSQVLQSLGILTPGSTTTDPCIRMRIEKGEKDCRPERERNRE